MPTYDLTGRVLLPSFTDAHCHILPIGLFLQQLDLSACRSREDVLDALRDRERQLEPGKWLLATMYDQNKFQDGHHLTADELDLVSVERPILVRHVSGHASVVNHLALQVAGVLPDSPDPLGGAFSRGKDGSLTGLCLEEAHNYVSEAVPHPSHAEMVEAICLACDSMREYGIGSATDMLTGRYGFEAELAAYHEAFGRVRTRLRLMPLWSRVFGAEGVGFARYAEWKATLRSDQCKLLGIKLFADGAIGSGTAGIYGRFLVDSGLYDPGKDVDGKLLYSQEELTRRVRMAHEHGESVAIHAIGDLAVDQVLNAYEATGEPAMHRLEHAMLLRDAQIARIQDQGIHVTLQPEFLHWFGPTYRRQLGEERASRLIRARSLLRAGIPISLNSDRPIVAGDPWTGILAATQRPEGFVEDENISLHEALYGYTTGGTRANRDGGLSGGGEVGEIADLAVWDGDGSAGKPALVRMLVG